MNLLNPTIENDVKTGTIGMENLSNQSSPDDIIRAYKAPEQIEIVDKFFAKRKNEIKQQINISKNNSKIRCELANIHLARKKYDHARRIFKEVVISDPTYSPAIEGLILTNMILNDFEQADKYYNELLKLLNDRSDVLHKYVIFKLFYKGVHDQDNINECKEKLQIIIDKEGNNYQAINTMGLILISGGKLDEAKTFFEKALSINNKCVDALNNLGVYYSRTKNIKNALECFRKALALNKAFIPAHDNIIHSFLVNNEPQKAIKYLEEVKKSGIILSHTWKKTLGIIFNNQNKFSKAICCYLEYLIDVPDDQYILNNIGFCYLVTGKLDKSEEYLKRSYIISKSKGRLSSNHLVLYNLGRLYFTKRDYERVGSIANEILYYFPNNHFGLYLRARLSMIEGDYIKAKELLYKALDGQPQSEEILISLSFILDSIERNYKESINLMRETRERGMMSKFLINNYVYALVRDGQFEEANKYMNEVKKPWQPELYATKGMYFIRKGLLKQGENQYNIAIKKLKNRESKNIARQMLAIEKAIYFKKSHSTSKSIKLLEQALSYGDTYLTNEIKEEIASIQKR
jgi:tetratricopeptide (TPR) repeat protein